MPANLSAPPGPVVPSLAYRDVAKAIDWLRGAFGFTERLLTEPEPNGNIHHTQLITGRGSVILTGHPGEHPNGLMQSVMVRIDHIDRHYERAKQFGARILDAPGTKPFGERQYNAEDLEGHRWTFTETVDDVHPEAWGAIVADLQVSLDRLHRPRWCYIEIPAIDVQQSAAFYEKVFGWNIRHRETGRPSFDDATGYVSGAWVQGRPPAREPGLMSYIWVDQMELVLNRVAAHGGGVVDSPHHDSPGSTSWIATFHDPAGNLIGLYEEAAPDVP